MQLVQTATAQSIPTSLGAQAGIAQATVAANGAQSSGSNCITGGVRYSDKAVVTLITSNTGYPAGAMSLAGVLEALDSKLRRIVLVTPDVNDGIKELLRTSSWEVHDVPAIECNQVLGPEVTAATYDLGEDYQRKKAKWLTTCSKFHAWNLTFLKKVIFLDADTMPIKPLDNLVDHPSAFAAAPDTFPADQFNSGVMVITPSQRVFEELMAWNAQHGTAEGGDQCLLNEYFSEWFFNAWDHPEAGRLPWVMNVAASYFTSYKTLARMQARDEPAIVHFVGGESKPWHFVVLKFQGQQDRIPENARRLIGAWDQMYWVAKSGKLCTGGLEPELKRALGAVLEEL